MNLIALIGRHIPNGDWHYVLYAPQPNISWVAKTGAP